MMAPWLMTLIMLIMGLVVLGLSGAIYLLFRQLRQLKNQAGPQPATSLQPATSVEAVSSPLTAGPITASPPQPQKAPVAEIFGILSHDGSGSHYRSALDLALECARAGERVHLIDAHPSQALAARMRPADLDPKLTMSCLSPTAANLADLLSQQASGVDRLLVCVPALEDPDTHHLLKCLDACLLSLELASDSIAPLAQTAQKLSASLDPERQVFWGLHVQVDENAQARELYTHLCRSYPELIAPALHMRPLGAGQAS